MVAVAAGVTLTAAEQAELDRLAPQWFIFRQRYWSDPRAFVTECFHWNEGEGPTPYQLDILDLVAKHERVSYRGPRGLGKSTIGAWLILWWSLTRDLAGDGDWKIITTASAWRQLKDYLWPEVHKWVPRLKWEIIGRKPLRDKQELLYMGISLKHGAVTAVASDQPDLIEGAHANHLLYIYDEAKVIPAATFDATEGAFSNAGPNSRYEAKAVAMSTPGEPNGRFYDIQRHSPEYSDWRVRAVTLRECIKAGQISSDWVLKRLKQWGRDSDTYINRVLGQFATANTTGVIPLSWIEDANERWRDWVECGRVVTVAPVLGVDVGGGSENGDDTVMAPAFAHVVSEIRRYKTGDTMETAGRAKAFNDTYHGTVRIDAIGLGAGPCSRLKELKVKVEAFIGSGKSTRKDRSGEMRFTNRRSEAYWMLRDLLNPAYKPDVCLPPDEELIGDLTAPKWHEASNGRVQVETKPDIRKRIGRSTNAGDAVVMALYEPNTRAFPTNALPISFEKTSVWKR